MTVGAASDLLAGLLRDPWGQVSPSVYETGRLVTLAPWLTGHRQRVEYLLRTQRPDGGWGGPGGYALVPTLSAVEALLSELRRDADDPTALSAVDRGLTALSGWLRDWRAADIPDVPAIELTAPALVEQITAHIAGPDRWAGTRLTLPGALSGATLAAVRARAVAGGAVPEKLLHAWEVVGGSSGIRLEPPGTVGASPAATAAWLAGRRPAARATLPAGQTRATAAGQWEEPARHYLEVLAQRHGGPVPCAAPITVFERAWVLSWLVAADVPVTVPSGLVRVLETAVDNGGTPAGPGLPADADTTAVAYYALARLGVAKEPAGLWAYEMDTHFCTWQGEDGASVTVNAHVLEAFGQYLATIDLAPRYAGAMDRITRWLCRQQRSDGAWLDRWHASPYYATVCCVSALHLFGRGAVARSAVARAVHWVLSTQRPDGSWGCWRGTAEETAYALRILLARPEISGARAVAHGHAYLTRSGGFEGPAMWHDKDLYSPIAIVRAAVISALHQAQRHLS